MASLAPGRTAALRATPAVVVAVALVLAAGPALAEVSATTDEVDTVDVVSDDPGDVVNVACVGGQVNVNGSPAAPALACDAVRAVRVDPAVGADGAQTVNLGGLTQLAFPALERTAVDVADFDADTVTGSEGRDVITADALDQVTGGLGDDYIQGAGTALGGAGDDLLRDISGEVRGGAGNDRIVNPGAGPIDGGDGRDVVVADYSASPLQQAITLYLSNSLLGPAPGVGAESTGIEEYDITTSTGAKDDTIDSTAYSGAVVVSTLAGNDTIRTGPGADVIDGGAGNDVLNPGGGSDVVRGGEGDDTIMVRDGVADVVDCGPGTDAVTADRVDVLVDCEIVSLPAPDTGSISGYKKVVKGTKPVYTFGSPVAGAVFECQIDAGGFRPCSSPFTVKTRKLPVGKHTLAVRAVQPAGNVDPTPSTFVFKVKKKHKPGRKPTKSVSAGRPFWSAW
jgi:hypothetical protein